MLDCTKFRPITISDRTFFLERLSIQNSQSCECAFANIFLYQKPYAEEFTVYKNRILILERKSGVLHFPIGEYFLPQELAKICDTLKANSIGGDIIYDVPSDYCHYEEFFQSSSNEGEFDYIYDLKEQSELTGAKLRKKRNLISQFKRNYQHYQYEAIDSQNVEIAIKLAKDLNSHLTYAPFLAKEEMAMEIVKNYFNQLDMNGLLLYVDNNPIGFSLFSPINSNCIDIHFEKADHDYKGAPQILTQLVAQMLLAQNYQFMNREQDMDEPGLRKAKNSLSPCHKIERKTLTR